MPDRGSGGGSSDEEGLPGAPGFVLPPALDPREPIGVPPGFTVDRPIDTSWMPPAAQSTVGGLLGQVNVPVSPRYFVGDEWDPANLAPSQIRDIQRQMAQAGLLTGNFQYGTWGPESADAYTLVLGYANATGLRDRDALGQLVEQGEAMSVDEHGNIVPPGPKRAPLVVQLPNRQEVEQVFRRSVIDTIGAGWDRARISRMVDAYMAEVERPQREAYDAEVEGGTVVNAPSPESFAESYMREQDPEGVATGEALNWIDQVLDNLSGWGSG